MRGQQYWGDADMPNHSVFFVGFSLALSACGSKPGFPENVIEQAATCAVVAASDARSTVKSLDTPLPLARQSQIIQYALIAGARDPGFSRDNANAVVNRMQSLQERITGDKWVPLVAPCKAAFPEAELGRGVALPAAPGEAEMACYALGDFMSRALGAYEDAYRAQLIQYGGLTRKLEPVIETVMTDRGIKAGADKERRAEKNKALATAAKLGTPSKVLDVCLERFPPDTEVKLPEKPKVSAL